MAESRVLAHAADLALGPLFSKGRDALVVVDSHTGLVVLWNPAAEALFGCPADEAVGMPLEAFVPERFKVELRANVEQYRASGRCGLTEASDPMEMLVLRKDGEPIWVEVTLDALGDPPLGHRYVLAVIRDVTGRTRAHDRASRLQAVTAAVSAALTSAQVAAVIVEQGVAALGADAGFVAEVVAGGDELEVLAAAGYPPDLLDVYQRFSLRAPIPASEAVRTGEPVWLETTEDLTARFPEAAAMPAARAYQGRAALPLVANGQVIGVIGLSFHRSHACAAEDRAFAVTLAHLCAQALERTRLHQRVQDELDQRCETEERYRTLVEQFPVMCYICTPDEQMIDLYISPQVRSLLAIRPEDWMADSNLWLHHLHRADRERVMAAWRQMLATGGRYSVEYRMHTADQRLVWVYDEAVLVRDQAGAPTHVQGIMLDVTARKQAEEARRQAEARYRALIEHLPPSAYVFIDALDDVSSTLYVSPNVERILGFTPADWLADPALSARQLHPHDRERVLAEIARSRATGQRFSSEYRMLARDGRVVWLQDEAEVVPDQAGTPQFLQGVVLDISARKQAEIALQESHRHLAEAQRIAHLGSWEWDLAADRLAWSDELYRICGVERQAFAGTGQAFLELVHPLDRARLHAAVEEIKHDHAPHDVVVRIVRPDGAIRVIHARAEVGVDAAGVATRVSGTAQDVTERRQADEGRRRAEARYQALIEHLPATTYVYVGALDDSSTALYVSRNVEAILGYAPSAWLTEPRFFEQHLHPDDHERVMAEVARSHATGERFSCSYRMLARDGRVVWLQDEAEVIRDEPGTPQFLQGVVLDITERKRVEEGQRLLAEADRRLGNSLDYEATLQAVARLAVPDLADWCVVHMLGEEGQVRRVAMAHRDPTVEQRLDDLGRRFPLDPGRPHPVLEVLRAGESRLMDDIPPSFWDSVARDPEQREVLREQGFRSAMVVPLLAHGRVLGALSFLAAAPHVRYAASQFALAQELANRCALAIENAKLYRQARVAVQQAQALYQAALAIGGELDPSARLERVLDAALELVRADGAEVTIAELPGGDLEIVATRGLDVFPVGERLPAAASLAGVALTANRPLRVPDALEDPRTWLPDRLLHGPVRDVICVPLADPDGPFGVLAVFSRQPSTFTTTDERLLVALAGLAAAAIREARLRRQVEQDLAQTLTYANELNALFTSTRGRAARLRQVMQAGQEMIGARDLDALLHLALKRATTFGGFESGGVLLGEPDGSSAIRASYGRGSVRAATGAGERAAVERRPLVLDEHGHEIPPDELDQGHRWLDVLCFPLVAASGRALGALVLSDTIQPGYLESKDLDTLQLLAEQLAALIDSVQLQRRLQRTLDDLLALHQAGQVLGSSLESEEVGRRLLGFVERAPGFKAGLVRLVGAGGRLELCCAAGEPAVLQRAPRGANARAARRAALATSEARSFLLRRRGRGLGSAAGLFLPLRVRDRTQGVIEVYGGPTLVEEETVELLRSLSTLAAGALENARLYRELAERERRLQDLLGRLFQVQEEERRRVAYEVHDGLAQLAAAAQQHLEAYAARSRARSPETRQALQRALELERRTVHEARRVIAGLRPTVLDDFGLASALRVHVEALRAEHWQVEYDEQLGPDRLPPPIETALFRVAQEALENVRKHADTHRASLTLQRHDRGVQMEVRDWGSGFRSAAVLAAGGPSERVGLAGMQERVALLGGRCEIRSRPGAGTRILVEVPLS